MVERGVSSLILLYCLLLLTIALFPLESEARILAEIHKDGNGSGSRMGVDPSRSKHGGSGLEQPPPSGRGPARPGGVCADEYLDSCEGLEFAQAKTTSGIHVSYEGLSRRQPVCNPRIYGDCTKQKSRPCYNRCHTGKARP